MPTFVQQRNRYAILSSDIILLGTEEQVRLAVHAAHELATGKPIHT
ncbi:hypothetical protein [Tunturiibacter psychrotolerans]